MRAKPVRSGMRTDFLLRQLAWAEPSMLVDTFRERIGKVSVHGVSHSHRVHISGGDNGVRLIFSGIVFA